MKYLSLLTLLLSLTSCATTTGDARKSEPHFLFSVNGNIDEIATCVLHHMEEEKKSLTYEYRNLTDNLKEIKGSASTYNMAGYGGEVFNLLVTFQTGTSGINVTIQETTPKPSDIAKEARNALISCESA